MQDVGTDLRAPFDAFLLPLELGLFLLAFLEFQVVEVRLEDAQGVLPVVELGAGLRVLDGDAGGNMPHADAGLHLVDILAARTGGAEGIPFQVGGIDLDLDGVVHQGIDKDRREGGLPLALRVVGRDADQAVHAVFGFQVAVGIVALELDGARLDAGLVAFQQFGDRHLVAVALAPAGVHTHKHRRPVVGLGAARPGIDGQHGAQIVALGTQHVAHLQRFKLGQQLFVGSLDVIGGIFAEVQEGLQVGIARFERIVAVHPVFHGGDAFHEGFRSLRVIPEIGCGGLGQFLGQVFPFPGDVDKVSQGFYPMFKRLDLF